MQAVENDTLLLWGRSVSLKNPRLMVSSWANDMRGHSSLLVSGETLCPLLYAGGMAPKIDGAYMSPVH